MLFHLPGTATEDMALGAGRSVPVCTVEVGDTQIAAIRDAVLLALDGLIPTPFDIDVSEAAEDPYQEVDISDDANED